jgi:hypothetical protein
MGTATKGPSCTMHVMALEHTHGKMGMCTQVRTFRPILLAATEEIELNANNVLPCLSILFCDILKGDFHEDKRQGRGTFHFANGNVFVGQFSNGVFEGEGRYTFEGGSYEGEWRSGRYHGQGSLQFADGSSYRGHFNDGVADGEGEEISASGTLRRGYWKNGRPIQSDSDDP